MKVALIQLTSVLDPKDNLKKIKEFLSQIKMKGVEYVFLPECFYSMSDGTTPTPFLVERENEHYRAIQDVAKKYKVYLLGGSVAHSNPGHEKVLNRNYNFGPDGKELGYYDKRNLFACDLRNHSSKKVLNESDVYMSGDRELLLNIGPMKIGMGICFDLRFPELARQYSSQGANVLSFSSAFTVPTGRAHWHTLNRARAIENQCYVVASAQWGNHNDKIKTFGHSLIIDPWGEILADAGEGEKVVYANLDFEHLTQVRSRLDVIRSVWSTP